MVGGRGLMGFSELKPSVHMLDVGSSSPMPVVSISSGASTDSTTSAAPASSASGASAAGVSAAGVSAATVDAGGSSGSSGWDSGSGALIKSKLPSRDDACSCLANSGSTVAETDGSATPVVSVVSDVPGTSETSGVVGTVGFDTGRGAIGA